MANQKKIVDQINFQFVTKALKQIEPHNGQFCIAIAMRQDKNFMVISDQRLNDKEVIEVLRECMKAVQSKGGGIIMLN